MKRFVAIFGLMIVSSTAAVAAPAVTCRVGPFEAHDGGLMNTADYMVATTKIQDPEEMDYNKCARFKSDNYKILLCVATSGFVGGLDAAVFTYSKDADESEIPTVTSVVLGTKRDGKGLMILSRNTEVVEPLKQRLWEAGIQIPGILDGNMDKLDDATKEGMRKGILTAGEIVFLGFEGCNFSK